MPSNSTTKKSKQKKNIPCLKSVLANPQTKYWPEINAVECQQFDSVLDSLQNNTDPAATTDSIYETIRKSTTFGLSSTIRCINNSDDNIAALLLSADIKPKYTIHQIIILAISKNKNIHILCIPNLEKYLKKIVNFSCYCVGIYRNNLVENPSTINQLSNWIETIHKRFPIPAELLQNFHKNKAATTDKQIEQMNISGNTNHEINQIKFEDLYLIRSHPTSRTFIPKSRNSVENSLEHSLEHNSDYIPFNNVNEKKITNCNINSICKAIDNCFGNKKSGKKLNDSRNGLVKQGKKLEKSKKKKKILSQNKEVKNILKNTENITIKYKPLLVHKIQPNINKVKKKKNKMKK